MICYIPRVSIPDKARNIALSETLPQIKPTVKYDSTADRWRVYVGLSRTDFNMTSKGAAEIWAEYTDGWYDAYCYHNILANGLKPFYL